MTKRRVFFSFHYENDAWRAAQVRNMGVVEGDEPLSDNDWEKIKRGGYFAIKNWIDNQLYGKSCTIVLIGEYTAEREWVRYEIEKSWELGKGVFGIYIHRLKNQYGLTSRRGDNPFNYTYARYKNTKVPMSNFIKTYDYPFFSDYADSTEVYNYIRKNIGNWVEEAIQQREIFRRIWG